MWQRCVEFLVFTLCAGGAVVALFTAIASVVTAYKKTRSLRTIFTTGKAFAARDRGADHAKAAAEYWAGWRTKMAEFGKDLGQIANPMRTVAIDFVKESANWGRLGIQYALIGNGGALAALPYLLNQEKPLYKLALPDAIWSATWFATGLSCAAACCGVAYLDFLVNATSYWANFNNEIKLLNQRHFETEDELPVAQHVEMLAALQATSVRTSLCGLSLAFVAWFALAWGAFRLIVSLST